MISERDAADAGCQRNEAKYEAVIGIECHVELKTATKMFCGCPNEFGGEPNTKVCPVCLALPGALPVPNAAAIEHMIARRAGVRRRDPGVLEIRPQELFLSGHAQELPDLAVRHADHPGRRRALLARRRDIARSAGSRASTSKKTPANRPTRAAATAGSPVRRTRWSTSIAPACRSWSACRIPTSVRPMKRSAYLDALKRTFVELGVSDVKMEEGSLRCDANVSVRLRGAAEYGTKTEIKNMNSFRSVHRAIESEIERQIAVLESGGRVIQETRGWDEAAGVTHSMRSKEEGARLPLFPRPRPRADGDRRARPVERIRARAAGMPVARFERYIERVRTSRSRRRRSWSTTPSLAALLRSRRRGGRQSAGGVVNFVLGDLSRLANESGVDGRRSQGNAGSVGRARCG